ncbi:MAG: beta-ketoacyl-ACP synthase I [Xanthomonadaceae bacterium]|nr:beta-ketoacyl-ACP synthase I [Xanthomonadaceae bacterium]
MRRVVVTGIGTVSSIGNDVAETIASLREGKSGIRFNDEYRDLGFRSQVSGAMTADTEALVDRRALRFMGDAAAYAHVAMQQAIADSGLGDEVVSHDRTGLVVGTGGGSPESVVAAADTLRAKGVKRIGPYAVTKTMASTTTACLATPFRIKGVNYSISSACATSAHCIGNGAELIQWNKQDVVFAGGGEELHWSLSSLFDAMGALSTKYNDSPERASRAYDRDRDGFVISGGGGIIVLEEYEHAKRRGAKIYAEVVGYGATSDGHDMVAPSGEGATRCMQHALESVRGPVDYLNTHGTSTPVGDAKELEAVRAVFGGTVPPLASTKSLTGHSLGAAGVHEAIFSLLMMEHGFIAASANIENLDPVAEGFPIVRETHDAKLSTVMSNSFGFGGTNATLVFRKI